MRVAIVLLSMLGAWISGYLSGSFPWLGYASMTRSSFGAGGLTIIGENRSGLDVGLESFVFRKGQQIVIEYDTDIRAGSLWFHVFRPFDGELGDGPSEYVTTSGKGTWTMPVEVTDYYHITIEPTTARGAGRGWDLSYTVRWGARPPQR